MARKPGADTRGANLMGIPGVLCLFFEAMASRDKEKRITGIYLNDVSDSTCLFFFKYRKTKRKENASQRE